MQSRHSVWCDASHEIYDTHFYFTFFESSNDLWMQRNLFRHTPAIIAWAMVNARILSLILNQIRFSLHNQNIERSLLNVCTENDNAFDAGETTNMPRILQQGKLQNCTIFVVFVAKVSSRGRPLREERWRMKHQIKSIVFAYSLSSVWWRWNAHGHSASSSTSSTAISVKYADA